MKLEINRLLSLLVLFLCLAVCVSCADSKKNDDSIAEGDINSDNTSDDNTGKDDSTGDGADDGANNDTGGGASEPDKGEPSDADVFWTEGITPYIVVGNDLAKLPESVDYDVYNLTNKAPGHKAHNSAETKHEIIIGKADRKISRQAYSLLNERVEMGFEAYVIYSSNTSVAIAFSGEEALDMALEELFTKHLKVEDGKIELKPDILANYSFNLYDRLQELDAEYRKTQWENLEKYINDQGYDGAKTVAALKKLYALYSDDAYIWLANLYEPDIYAETGADGEAPLGGFYYSNSARNTVTFLPDIESTRQALDLIRYSGMTSDLKDGLPDEMGQAIVNFTRSLYDSSKGIYVHPQWADLTLTDERRGRDYTNARSVLSAFGTSQSAAASASFVSPKSAVTMRFISGEAAAVSKVVATAAVDHLSSKEAFLEYLNKQNWNDSYTSGNRIAAQSALIYNAGLMDVCLDFFDSIQNKTTGMWSPNQDDNAVNGFLKISAIYASYAPKLGRTINYASEAALTCEAVLESKATPSTVCWVYNVWYSLGNIIGLLRSTGIESDVTLANEIQARLRTNAPKYIEIAAEKYAPFRKDDGSFSFTADYSSDKSQGMPVCPSRQVEGDVNATYISMISVPARIFAALGYKDAAVDVYTPNDFKLFLKELEGLSHSVKTNTEFGGKIGFNGDTIDGLLYSSAYTEIDTLPDDVVEEGYAYAYLEEENEDSNFMTFGKKGQSILENKETVEPKIAFRTIQGGGTRYVYDMRVRFNSGTMDGGSWHTRFSMYYSSGRFWYMLCYTNSKGQLCLDSVSDPLAVLEPGKWYNLRFEYYTDSAEKATDKICKVYVDGKYVGDGGVSGSAGSDKVLGYSYVEYRCQATDLSWSFDDIETTTDNEAYTPPPPIDTNDGKGKFFTDQSIKKKRYDYDLEEYILPAFSDAGSASLNVVDKNLVFAKLPADLNPVATEDYIHFVQGFGDPFWNYKSKATVVEFDLNYKDISADTPMKLRFGKDIVVSKKGDSIVLSYKYNGVNTAIDLGTTSEAWNNIRLEQYWYRLDGAGNVYTIIKVFVNNVYKGELKTEYDSASHNFYIYLLKSETKASLTIDNLLITHLNMPYVDEESIVPDNPGASDEEYVPSASVMGVKGGADGIVVIMHDDGSISSAKLIDKLYEKYGIKGDVALVVNNILEQGTTGPIIENVNFWKKLINTGRWNITNHSYTHTWWGTDANALEKEVVTSQTILRNLFTTQRVLTYAYPGFSAKVAEIGKDNVYKDAYELVAKHYIGARDYEGRTATLGEITWIDVNSCSIGEGWAGSSLSDIAAAAGGKMAVVFMHRVVETDTEAAADTSATTVAKLETIVSAISDNVKAGKVWNAFFEEAILYLREAEGATVTVTGDATALTVSLTDTMTDNETYNYPLTVRIEVPASWGYAKIEQGTSVSYATAYNAGDKWVIDAEIVPDGGDANITPATRHDIPTTETETRPLEEYLEEPEFDPGDANGDYYCDPENEGLRVNYDSAVTDLPDTDAKELLSIKDGYLLFDDGDQESAAKYVKYYLGGPSGFLTGAYTNPCSIIEFDFSIKQVYGSWPIQFKIANINHTVWFGNVDGSNRLYMNATVTAEDGTTSTVATPLGISVNTWGTVRFEHYYNDAMLKVYVNNEYAFEIATDTGSVGAFMVYLTSNERGKTSDADILLDNVFLGHFDKEYVHEEVVKDDTTTGGDDTTTGGDDTTIGGDDTTGGGNTDTYVDADGNGEYYLSNTDGARWDYDSATPSMPSSLDHSDFISIDNGSLLVDDGEASSEAISVSFYKKCPEDFASYHSRCTVFEFDFNIKQVWGNWPIQISVANKQYTIWYTKFEGDGYKLTMDATVAGADGSTSTVRTPLGVPVNDWSTLRFEHYYDAKMLKVYVNNSFVFDIATGEGNINYGCKIYLTSDERKKESDADLRLDNIFVGHVDKAFVAGNPAAQN